MLKLTDDFAEHEFQCPCCGACDMDPDFMALLQHARDEFGQPLVVNSGFRCVRHNEEVGGAKGSFHLKGMAADIRCADSVERYRLVQIAIDLGLSVGIKKGFVHVDNRAGKPVLFLYAS